MTTTTGESINSLLRSLPYTWFISAEMLADVCRQGLEFCRQYRSDGWNVSKSESVFRAQLDNPQHPANAVDHILSTLAGMEHNSRRGSKTYPNGDEFEM